MKLVFVVALSLMLGGAAAFSPVDPPPQEGGRLILVVNVDTLRRDALGVYGNTRHLSPGIDALAKRGLIFDAAYAASNHTRPSVASLMTGLYPTTHGFWSDAHNGYRRHTNLADVFPKPFHKVLVNANPNTVHLFAESFDKVWAQYPEPGSRFSSSGYLPAEYVFSKALELINSPDAPRDLFLYVQPADPHGPYYPLRRYPDLFQNDPLEKSVSGAIGTPLADLRWDESLAALPPQSLRNARNRYDAEVRYLDEELTTFLAVLLPKYRQQLIIVTSDHGESFLEHGVVNHGTSLYDEQIRVPLVVVDSTGRLGEPGRVSSLVSHVDLLSTIAEWFEVAVPTNQGTSLQSTAKREGQWWALSRRRSVVSEVHYSTALGDFSKAANPDEKARLEYFKSKPVQTLVRATVSQSRGLTGSRLIKYVRNESKEGTGILLRFPGLYFFEPHYHDMFKLHQDPRETTNAVDMSQALEALAHSPLKDVFPPTDLLATRLTPEQLERLRALGYIR